jgi:hypothetical protein
MHTRYYELHILLLVRSNACDGAFCICMKQTASAQWPRVNPALKRQGFASAQQAVFATIAHRY